MVDGNRAFGVISNCSVYRREGFPSMRRSEIKVFLGVDMAKGEHYAQAITTDGEELFNRPVSNDQTAIEKVLEDAGVVGPVAVVVDMTSAGAQLMLESWPTPDTSGLCKWSGDAPRRRLVRRCR